MSPEHEARIRTRQLKTCNEMWLRAAKEALAGDMRALRNRVQMAEMPPVEVVLSKDTPA